MKELDEKCKKIVTTLFLHKGKMRFNELYNTVRKEMKVSKPVFVEHLKHLREDKYITRKKEQGKQNVFYSFNYEDFKRVEYEKTIDKYLSRDGAPFLQLTEILEFLTMKDVLSLKIRISEVLKPKEQLKLDLPSLLVNSLLFEYFEDWIVEKCKKDKDYGENMMKALNSIITNPMAVMKTKE